MTDPRTQISEWLTTTGWTIPQMLRGTRLDNGDVPSERHAREWLDGGSMLPKSVAAMIRFVTQTPSPGAYADWEQSISERAGQRKAGEEQALIRRRDAVERERRDRVARLLADESAPRPRGTWFPSERWVSVSTKGAGSAQ